jgi:hypothetical protein
MWKVTSRVTEHNGGVGVSGLTVLAILLIALVLLDGSFANGL